VLIYDDVAEAADWLCDAFGLVERLRAGDHRAELTVGDGAVVLTESRRGQGFAAPDAARFRTPRSDEVTHALVVRVVDARAHHDHARRRGARILQAPADHPFGERQYTAEDLAGHRWTFSQSIADVAPEDWGGETR
jgi:uncharacterized glyoxalase superfamily protein PhnB